MPPLSDPIQPLKIPGRLLAWYDRHRRRLPWRALPGERADPYRVWLSEIMLQQTTVATVTGYFDRFMARWPTVNALAAAPLDDVLHAWQGLGYYARARNLHACAKVVVDRFDGVFPDTEPGLRELPGIGLYTAAAVAAIAFDRASVVMDGNVERVMARLYSVTRPLPGAKPLLYDHAAELTPQDRPGDYAQAVMDLGATICTPRKPKCILCPLSKFCSARASGSPETFPCRSQKAARPKRYGVVFWLSRSDGAVLLRRRPESGLLGGLMEFPSSPWVEHPVADILSVLQEHAPLDARNWRILPTRVIHVFTHFQLELTVAVNEISTNLHDEWNWVPPRLFNNYALPTLMKKVVKRVQS